MGGHLGGMVLISLFEPGFQTVNTCTFACLAMSCYFVLIYNAYLSYLSRRNHRKLAFMGISGGYTGEKESYRTDAVSNIFLLVHFELFHKLLAHHRAAIFRWVFVSFLLKTHHVERYLKINFIRFQHFRFFGHNLRLCWGVS